MTIEVSYNVTDVYIDYAVSEVYVDVAYNPSSGGVAWGDITGTLSNQTDLQAALDLKQSTGNYLTTQTNYVFSNSNGVTFGTNGSTVTASVFTDYQSTGNYLTTAMQSNASTQFVQASASFNGTNISGTIGSNGVSLSVAAGGGAGDGYNIIAAGGSTANSTGTIVFSNANGVSFGLNGATVTATVQTNYQSTGNYLTTARASNDAIGLNTAITQNGVSMTANSSGLSLNFPAFLTTAAQSNHSHNFATTTTNGASIIVATTNSNGATIGVPSFLTTARASTDAVGLNTALTANGVSWTVNSSGLSLNVPAFLTTAMQSASSSVFAKTGFTSTTTAGTAIVATHDTNGLSMGIPQYLTTSNQSAQPVAASGSNGSFNFSTLSFGNSNGFSFYTTNGSIVGSYTDAGAGGGISAVIVSAGTTNNAISNFSFADGNGVSFGVNGSTITASVYDGTISQFEPYPLISGTAVSSHTANSRVFVPFLLLDDLAVSRINVLKSFNINTTSSTNSSYSGSYIQSQTFGLWSRGTGTNSSTLAQFYSTTQSWGVSSSITSNSISMGVSYLSQANSTSWATSSWSSTSAGLNLTGFWSGLKPVPVPALTTLTLGEYWAAIQNSSAITTAGSSVVPMVVSNVYVSYPITTIGDWGRTSGSVSQSMIFNQGLGLASNTTATTVALSAISASVPHRVYFNFSNYPLI